MSHSPNSFICGVRGIIGAAAQVIATTKYSAGAAFQNRFGDRVMAVTIICDTAYNLSVWGSHTDSVFSSVADTGSASGALLASVVNCAPTSKEGVVYYVRIAGMKWVLPVLTQASGGNATVTMTYQTYND